MVNVVNKTRSTIDLSLIRRITAQFLVKYKLTKQEVSVVFVGDQRIKQLNKQYRKINKVTDVLSFREQDSTMPEPDFLGEVIIDYQQIKRQAKKMKHSQRQELLYILVHGLLHLVGHDDKTKSQAEKMHQLTKRFLNSF